jgi:bifunctional non-homologous end joining protein LigD
VTPPPLAQRIALGLMHATQVATPFHRPGWVYEEKVDGYRMAAMKADRMAAMKAGDGTRLISRTGIQHTKRFPELVRALDSLSAEAFLLDGEVAVYDRALISRFEWLRGRPKDEPATLPVYMVFDMLELGGKDLRREPLRKRRKVLEDLVSSVACFYSSTAEFSARHKFFSAPAGLPSPREKWPGFPSVA